MSDELARVQAENAALKAELAKARSLVGASAEWRRLVTGDDPALKVAIFHSPWQLEQWQHDNPRVQVQRIEHSTPQVGGGGISGGNYAGAGVGAPMSHLFGCFDLSYEHVFTVYYTGVPGQCVVDKDGEVRVSFVVDGLVVDGLVRVWDV